ncbi:FadR/GntR family transcriptional regulator [Amphritea sp. 2_MG-2023]|uniref:FadR/GntR family transcriptional regulator n=1 Tax=Amphritea TaxID=515417 RepID=UPI001C07205A|nr:FadR/GntR family transcriptional regulator [Amphritea sp. 2_MG-2023]MBU2966105.1 FadR family transcriptional regulator [Amphritea atlantica]MDO6418240.1 FadR/GntR family transcriptional regulator [Amphritea sp. 2_MG-2023]MDX2422762.1 FadR/GntR family transcriptional regulator [Amphritea sp.]
MSLDITPSLSSQIAQQIRQAIMDGSLKADDRLPTEGELALRYKVSRPTIREALKRLAAQNLVRSRRGPTGGTFINRPSTTDLSDALTSATTLLVGMDAFSMDDINQTRLLLETNCLQLAAIRINAAQLDALERELAEQQNDALTPEQFCASDVRFHRQIAEASGNPLLSFIMFSVIEALQPISNMVTFRFRERSVIIDQHQRILQALSQHDADQACAVLAEQVAYLTEKSSQAQQWKAQKPT